MFIEQHGDARFEKLQRGSEYGTGGVSDHHPIYNRAGWRDGAGVDQEWLILPEVWRSEVCNGVEPTFAAKVLAKLGMLTSGGARHSKNVRIEGRQTRVYVLNSGILEGVLADEK